jgi:hypothetical protein
MGAKIELVQTRSAQYLKHEEFQSGVVEAINQLVEELAKPEDPSSLTQHLKNFFEPLSFSDKFDSNLVSQVSESVVSQLLVRLTEEDLNQIQSGVQSQEFREFVKNLRQGLERAFSNVLASLSEGENHPLKTFLDQTDASSVWVRFTEPIF